ncbi:hypothetical protein COY26_03040 [Candidatus Woesearchaeota archaeon CG_4_10_14_0_2_um_filter_33_10]|nr:MAG: hypothetical protein AUJ83_04180 [Candidatus Woesearchaeota archaeon CG1_02_33_12]PIN78400.1 MAG: hypothetical protein COV14_03790 [Candidatus Woesearchaeota archaeon CG10_big_fil_rev_8_21_14_0_10_33_12]PIU72445.1 MAG: hypothetical protein COS79_02905 [Candidatus Woesearchaeota archaeon CG06_land_8_20_14_3_00_33_13]PIZ52972.1 MAG: hypothetical protein COY26_03040 [Candidatus Woesearchaeota archaeon CG_4_10_14_0_2_um_filter_33_10]
MAKSLEIIAKDPSLKKPEEEVIFIQEGDPEYKHPVLEYFINTIKDKKRREEIRTDINNVFSKYMDSIKKYHPTSRRAALLEQSYNLVPSEDEIKGQDKDSKEVLKQRLYSNPGRQYSYTNAIVGDEKKPKDITYALGKAAHEAVKEGWPVIGAGTGWWLANKWYKKGIGEIAKESFDHKWWQYLVGPSHIKDTSEFLAKAGLRSLWGLSRTPLLYAIGAYAAYKTLGYFLKRRKEKLKQKEVEGLENIVNNMKSQKKMMPSHEELMPQAA